MWHWHKSASAAHESLWQERLQRFPGGVISAGYKAGRIALDVYTEQAEEALVLQALYGGQATPLPETDWVAATAPEQSPPLLIRKKLVLTTSESPQELERLRQQYPGRILLSLPAEQAFGTGNHATTATCLRLLCDAAAQLPKPWSLIDVGCGTGVLALAGLKLGAAHAEGFDFDPKAVEVARRNIARNGGADELRLFQADVFEWEPAAPADVVLANLFSTVLQRAFPRLLRALKPGGRLIISGILREQATETLAAAQAAGLTVDKSITRGKWTTAQLHRP